MVRDRVGYVWYILKALEKGFLDMLGQGGRSCTQKKLGGPMLGVLGFAPILPE